MPAFPFEATLSGCLNVVKRFYLSCLSCPPNRKAFFSFLDELGTSNPLSTCIDVWLWIYLYTISSLLSSLETSPTVSFMYRGFIAMWEYGEAISSAAGKVRPAFIFQSSGVWPNKAEVWLVTLEVMVRGVKRLHNHNPNFLLAYFSSSFLGG